MTHDDLALILGGIDALGTVGLAVGMLYLFVRGDVVSRRSATALCEDVRDEILAAIRKWGGLHDGPAGSPD